MNDARAVAERLGKLGFDVILVENANRRTMSEKLTVLTGKIGRGDTAFVFYAGHGVAIKDGNYLLPTDTPQVNEGQEIRFSPAKASAPIRSSTRCRNAAPA